VAQRSRGWKGVLVWVNERPSRDPRDWLVGRTVDHRCKPGFLAPVWQNIPRGCLLVKVCICIAEAVLWAAGGASWLQRELEETTFCLQMLGEIAMGLWTLDADGVAYSSQTGLVPSPSLSLSSLGFWLHDYPWSLEEAFLSLLGKKQIVNSGGEAERNSTLLKKGKKKVQVDTTHHPQWLKEIVEYMRILVYCWFINQITTWRGRQQEGRKISHLGFSGSHQLLFMKPWKCTTRFTRHTCWRLWAGGDVYGCRSYCSYITLSAGHLEIGPTSFRVWGLRIADSSPQQRGRE